MATLRALVLATTIAALLGCGLGSQGPETEDRAPGRIPRAEAVIASVAGAEAESRAIAEAILGASDPVLAAAQAGQGLWTAARAYAAASLDDRPLYWLRLATTTHLRADCGPTALPCSRPSTGPAAAMGIWPFPTTPRPYAFW